MEGDEYVVTAKVDTNSTVRFACLLYDCPSCPPKVQRKYQVHVPLKQLKQGESPQIVKVTYETNMDAKKSFSYARVAVRVEKPENLTEY